MHRSQVIEHMGSVLEVNERFIRVNLEVQSACAACHAKSVCNPGEKQDKVVEISQWEDDFRPGELVKVTMEQRHAFRAVFLGYLLPFLLLMIALIISFQITSNELTIGLVALIVLPIYYGFLYLVRDKIRREFSFRIEKMA